MPSRLPSLVVLGLLAGIAVAQPPDPGRYSAEQYTELREERGHLVPMRDGVRLSVDVYRPKGEGRFPAILTITPYNNNTSSMLKRARWFAKRGYAVVLADSRGRFDSEGVWDPFDRKHKTDGYDLVEWIAKQRWCEGQVGMMGLSYMGWTQWWTATQAPPSLKAIVPEVAPPDQLVNGPYQNGVLVCWAIDWAAGNGGRVSQMADDGPYGGFAGRRQDFFHTPYADLNNFRGALDSPWFTKWIHENLATADYWKGIAYQTPESYAKVAVPSLSITGWFDANHPGSPMNYLAMKKHGASPAARRPGLVIGPWVHGYNQSRSLAGIDYGAQATLDMDGYICRFFDHHLKHSDNGIDGDEPVHLFVMGRNKWRAEKDWPVPGTKFTKYYLHSGGKANSLKGDGTLSTEAPSSEPSDTYTYDPAKPTRSPFTGGHIDGASDTRLSAIGDEVLVYTTPELTKDLEVIGPIEAKLFAATSARDTDWMVRLIDVSPDGYAAFLSEGVMRARCRDPQKHGVFTAERLSSLEPDKPYEYTIDFWRGTANVFQKGHRIRIEISSSWFPYYLRNLNTGADNIGLETKAVVARQKIFHDEAQPSHIVLPLMPAR
jgi:putative CocE/NonD family hydrolase